MELIARLQPHVVLLDVRMPGLSGIEVAARIVRSWPEIKVLLLSAYDDDYILAAFQTGAAGYLLKTAPAVEVVAAIRAACRSETVQQPTVTRKIVQLWQQGTEPREPSRLGAREIEVLPLLARGCCNKEIAARL